MTRKFLPLAAALVSALAPPALAQIGPADRVSGVPSRDTWFFEVSGEARVQSENLFAHEPASGMLAINDMLLPLHRLLLHELDIDVQTDLPIGLAEITLARRTALLVEGPDAFGPVSVNVYLPTTDSNYTVDATAYINLDGPFIQLDFGLAPDIEWLDPFYAFQVFALFNDQGVLCDQIDDLIEKLDHDDWEVREQATADLIAMGEKAIAKVRAALLGDPTPEQGWRLALILKRLLVVTHGEAPAWEGPEDAGQWDFKIDVWASVPNICDIHFMVGYLPNSGKFPSAGYNPHDADIELCGFPEGWSASYDESTGEIVVECGNDETPLTQGGDYEIKISTPTMNKSDPKPVGWHYTNGDGHKIGAPRTKGTLPTGPRF